MDKGRFNRVKLTVETVKYEKVNNTTVCNITFSFKANSIILAAMKDHKALNVLHDNSWFMPKSKNTDFFIRRNIEAKGVATCHEKDKFDKKIGRKIAYSKAFLEGYRKFHHIIDASIEALVNKHMDLSHTRDNLEAIINDEKSYLDKLRNCEK